MEPEKWEICRVKKHFPVEQVMAVLRQPEVRVRIGRLLSKSVCGLGALI